jgi:hypothetical protein
VVGWLALIVILVSAYEGYRVDELGTPLVIRDLVPRGGIDLQLAKSDADAVRILRTWAAHGGTRGELTDIAKQTLVRDTRFIATYALGWMLAALWAARCCGTRRTRRTVAAALVGAIAAAAACDLAENWWLGLQLGNAHALPFDRVASLLPDGFRTYSLHHTVALARAASMTKWLLLLLAGLVTLALAGGTWRRALLTRRPEREPTQERGHWVTFQGLLDLENACIFDRGGSRRPDKPQVVQNPATDEPRVGFRSADVIGLALSGGGIRSATFNLGLLQGLHRFNLLRLVDYVSSVSGGGYIAGLWSHWLAGRPPGGATESQHLFPSKCADRVDRHDLTDSHEERHLREFGRFLVPRFGFFEVETWLAIVAVIAGLLPALAIGASVVGLALVLWLACSFALACPHIVGSVSIIVLITGLTLVLFERWWRSHATRSGGIAGSDVRWQYATLATLAVLVVALVQQAAAASLTPAPGVARVLLDGTPVRAAGGSAFERWWAIAGMTDVGSRWFFSPRLFEFGGVWLAAAGVFLVGRLAYPIWSRICRRESLAAYDRVLIRLLALGVAWCGVALVWHLAVNIGTAFQALGAAIVAGGSFAALRNWIGLAFQRPSDAGWMSRLKPILPQALAYLTIVLGAAALGRGLIHLAGTDWFAWYLASAAMAGTLLVGLFIDPGQFGLHAFYRERLTRAYTGAVHRPADRNRGTDPRHGDDRRLSRLVGRPLHLVCCAANDLGGDPVATLSRGSRSAVLSRHGLAIGDANVSQNDVTLGAALTASAAAFNPNMGSVSKRLGPAVTFLMAALNLRLGLWLRHPRAGLPEHRRWPGLLFYREMFGQTSASGSMPTNGEVPLMMRDVHLSDGAHFENLGLYELVRRHCRYIIVADCTADPEVAFDDLGTALRRIREDFGIDVTLDIDPLRPGANGWSRQHAIVGTIEYSENDRGVIIYFKPSLTGDEPPDVLQYRKRNAAFPHEGTGDQFYDEAQWESYRRLGLHAVERTFEYVVDTYGANHDAALSGRPTADWVFGTAGHVWGATPDGLVDRILEMTQRFAALESELQQRPSRGILAEVFPEVTLRSVASVKPLATARSSASEGREESAASDLACILKVTQLMEDTWMACQLDRRWNHPLNLGWINLFARWATAPSFRFWWPLIGPMFSPGFRTFVNERYAVSIPAGRGRAWHPQQGRVEPLSPTDLSGLAATWWTKRSAQPRDWSADKALFQNLLSLPGPNGGSVDVQVGIVAVRAEGRRVGWSSDDFFVPPSLWGGGIGWHFLAALLHDVAPRFDECYVIVKAPPREAQHQVARDDQRSFIEQYRKMGFRQRLARGGDGEPRLDKRFLQLLRCDWSSDAIFHLDLKQWVQTRAPSLSPAQSIEQGLDQQFRDFETHTPDDATPAPVQPPHEIEGTPR